MNQGKIRKVPNNSVIICYFRPRNGKNIISISFDIEDEDKEKVTSGTTP